MEHVGYHTNKDSINQIRNLSGYYTDCLLLFSQDTTPRSMCSEQTPYH